MRLINFFSDGAGRCSTCACPRDIAVNLPLQTKILAALQALDQMRLQPAAMSPKVPFTYQGISVVNTECAAALEGEILMGNSPLPTRRPVAGDTGATSLVRETCAP